MLWILQKNEGKPCSTCVLIPLDFSITFENPKFWFFGYYTRTTTNLNKTSIFVQANNIWSSLANCDTLCRRLTVIKTDRCDYSEAFPKISTHSLLPSSRHKNKKVYKYIYTLQYFPKKTLAYFCVSQSGYVKVKHVYCFCFWQLTASFLVVFAPHTEIYYGDLLENKIGLAIMAAILLLWKYYLHILQVCLSSSK